MTPSTPHLFYIMAAYGLTFLGLGLFFGWTFIQWKKSIIQEKNSRESLFLSNNGQKEEARAAARIRNT